MAYFAELDDNNIVLSVISISNEICGEPELSFPDTELNGCDFISNVLKLDGVWKQTSYNSNFRKNCVERTHIPLAVSLSSHCVYRAQLSKILLLAYSFREKKKG